MSVAVDASATEVRVEPVLEVDRLRIQRVRSDRTDTIVSSVSLSLRPGETIGIVGESGSGKSMTARAITGLLPPIMMASGEVRYGGRNLLGLGERQWRAIRGREVGMILQDPFTMLNPVMRCGRILGESLLTDGRMGRGDRRAEAVRRLAEVGITDENVVERYPFQLSGGMRQRVAIAAALARDPKVLIADEPSTALDVATQREILGLIKSIQLRRGMALILITHDLRVAFAMCDRIFVLYAGSLVEVGPSVELSDEPLHPYTHGLLLSEPTMSPGAARLLPVAAGLHHRATQAHRPSSKWPLGACPHAYACPRSGRKWLPSGTTPTDNQRELSPDVTKLPLFASRTCIRRSKTATGR
jgi:peptide/nickel transport system ATP-binding protein